MTYPRVVSLVPSVTDFILRLGFPAEKVVGRTAFCIEPEEKISSIPTVGGTKKINLKKVAKLNPDMILMNHEENTREMYDQLKDLFGKEKILMTSIETLDEAIAELHRISQALGIEDRFKPFSHRFYREIKKIHHRYHGKVLYFIWKNPWMIAGSRTFIHSWLEYLGFENIGATFPGRYPQLTEDQIRNLKADIIFLSSEPYKFKEEDTMELQRLFGDQKQPIMKPVDGRYFIWYGYKMLEAIDYFRKVL